MGHIVDVQTPTIKAYIIQQLFNSFYSLNRPDIAFKIAASAQGSKTKTTAASAPDSNAFSRKISRVILEQGNLIL